MQVSGDFRRVQAREDRLHCRVVFLVVWSGTIEGLIEHLKINDLGDVEKWFALRAALQLVSTQQFGSPTANSVTLRLNESRFSVVDEA
jgi:hypothetical protein